MKEKYLARQWVRAYEEDGDGNEVYRPDNYKLPPARGREVLDLGSLSKGSRSIPGADDRPLSTSGHWTIADDLKTLSFQPTKGGTGRVSYELVSVDKEKLILRRRRPGP
jgi:hypothetical protein